MVAYADDKVGYLGGMRVSPCCRVLTVSIECIKRSPVVPPIPPAIIDCVVVSYVWSRITLGCNAVAYVQVWRSAFLLLLIQRMSTPRLCPFLMNRSMVNAHSQMAVDIGGVVTIRRRKMRSRARRENVGNPRGKGHDPPSTFGLSFAGLRSIQGRSSAALLLRISRVEARIVQ